jgi:hypothetical protein
LTNFSLVFGTWYSAFKNFKKTALLIYLSLVLGTWSWAFGKVRANLSLYQHLFGTWSWYSAFRNIKTNYSLDLTVFLGMSQQAFFLTSFSLVLGTWFSDFENIKTNCSLDQLQSGHWYFGTLVFGNGTEKLSLDQI